MLGLTVAACPCQLAAASPGGRALALLRCLPLLLSTLARLFAWALRGKAGGSRLCWTSSCCKRHSADWHVHAKVGSALAILSTCLYHSHCAASPLVVRFGTRFSKLLCLPVLHGTSNCCKNSPPNMLQTLQSLATSCQASPAIFFSWRSGSTIGLKCPARVCRWLHGFCCSCRHQRRFFQESIGLPPGSARAMCPYMSHMRSSAYVLHLSTLALWMARRAARNVRTFHSSQLSPGLRPGCITLRTCAVCVLLTALKMAAVFCQACPPTWPPPAQVFGAA